MSSTYRWVPRAVAFFFGLVLAGPSPAAPQAIGGRIIAGDTARAIPGAFVQLLDARGAPRATDLTDALGNFELVVREAAPGPLRVQIDAFGFARRTLDLAPASVGQRVDLGTIVLDPSPIELGEVRVEAREAGVRRGREWVRRNQLEGKGTFLAGAMLALDQPASIASYLSERTGLWVRYDERGQPLLYNPRGFSRCVSILVNRWPIERTGYRSIDEIPAESIAAIEIYERDRDLPQGYSFDAPLPGCGIVQVWLWNAW